MDSSSNLKEYQQLRAHIDDFSGKIKIGDRLLSLLECTQKRPVIILCIGTDRSTGDSLGPLVGMQLSRLGLSNLHIYGTLEDPVHALNLEENIYYIKHRFTNPFIIAVDACLGHLDSIGYITLADGPLRPGAGVHKQLPEVGEANLTGVVNVGGFMECSVLQNTRLNLVWRMSESISYMICSAHSRTR